MRSLIKADLRYGRSLSMMPLASCDSRWLNVGRSRYLVANYPAGRTSPCRDLNAPRSSQLESTLPKVLYLPKLLAPAQGGRERPESHRLRANIGLCNG